ncbi:MAG: glycoside hydrolase family 95 protein [Chlorobi bacterium]|nr:glycoside hydrolase family 95 protein [Chlorobiota bacterium]
MKNTKLLVFLFIITVFSSCSQNTVQEKKLHLWYDKPAKVWDDALPTGNGRMGAMDFGDPETGHIQFNEESLWAGKKFDNNNPNALKDLPKIRQYIFNEEIDKAYKLGNKSLLSVPPRFRSYQTFGDLYITPSTKGRLTEYRRDLCLNDGISTTTYTIDGVKYTKEVFVSAPDNVIVVHITADKPGSINAEITMTRPRDAKVTAQDKTLWMKGQIIDEPSKEMGPGGKDMKFAAKLTAENKGGNITAKGSSLNVENADEITLLLTAATDYNLEMLNFDRSIDPEKTCNDIIAKAGKKTYSSLKQAHIADHSAIFNRVSFNLGGNNLDTIPTDKRLNAVKKGAEDPELVTLYNQYGRYLLMGSSRKPGKLPANLQGIWNGHIKAPWNSDYHTNINLQMNYWPAEICNLSETALPLTDLVNQWTEPGKVTAKKMYGCNGWTMHHATDIFGKTAPNADMRWGMSPLSGVWMTFPLWRHFEFTNDKAYLKNKAYPVMKEAMQFVSDFLIEKDGYLVTNPSMSPENAYKLPGSNKPNQLTYAPTIDNQILMAHIDNCIEAAEILGVDADLTKQWKEIRAKIPPVRIGKDSTIMEWIKDYEEWEPGHRHMSHLMGLYPLAQITPETPELYEAAARTIEKRLKYGGGHTGWSRAWIINFFARLHQPETAYHHVLALLRKSTKPNLFDNHPPFQIDGNFGGTAGITEMLLQSHMKDKDGNFILDLLPALPKEWADGDISGIKGRGNFEVSMMWKDGKLETVSIKSLSGNKLNVRYNGYLISQDTEPGKTYTYNVAESFK